MKHLITTLLVSTLSSVGYSADFLAPFEHIHASKNGTPYVHSFGIEPAFTGRDLFVDHTFIDGDGFTEHETEIELEWAFTKRLGMIVEVPYIYEDEEGVGTAKGFGDLAIVPRALLIDTDRFLLTAQLEVVLPTGSSNFGGDTAVAPGLAAWFDLGNNFTLNSQLFVEHGFDANETELGIGLGLVKSIQTRGTSQPHSGNCHNHTPHAGLLNFHLEITGETPTSGADKGDIALEALFGISYGIIEDLDIRAGYFLPITRPNDFDHGFTTGLIFHF
jgi:hypothetical protein